MSIRFQPKNDKVLVRRAAEIKRTAGGILVPDVAKDKALRGQVLAVANSRIRVPAPTTISSDGYDVYNYDILPAANVKPGDTVTFGRYSGIEMSPLGDEFANCLLLSEHEIYGVLDGDEGVVLEVPTAEVE